MDLCSSNLCCSRVNCTHTVLKKFQTPFLAVAFQDNFLQMEKKWVRVATPLRAGIWTQKLSLQNSWIYHYTIPYPINAHVCIYMDTCVGGSVYLTTIIWQPAIRENMIRTPNWHCQKTVQQHMVEKHSGFVIERTGLNPNFLTSCLVVTKCLILLASLSSSENGDNNIYKILSSYAP